MSGDDSESAQTSHWERWTDDSGPFYQACAVFPFDSVAEPNGDSLNNSHPSARFATGITRKLLRNIPMFVLLTGTVYFSIMSLRAISTGEIQVNLPRLTFQAVGLLIPGLVIGAFWLYLIYRVLTATLQGSSVHRSTVFFVTTLILAAGTAHAGYTAWANAGATTEPAITVQMGYFLFVLVTGHLIYDGLALKTENLLARLGETSIVRQPMYDEFYTELTNSIGDTISIKWLEIPRSVGFAVVVALGPILLPVIVSPWAGWGELSYVAYSLVTLFVIAVLYDVFVLIYMFTELLRRDILEYQPFHPDDRGGFRDLGKFATRVNAILAVAGGYVAYRFYAEGILNLPSGGVEPSLLGVTWVVLYAGPIGAYVFLVLFWLYHSFWRLHSKMEEGRQQRIEELQREAKEGSQQRRLTEFQKNAKVEDPGLTREFVDPETDAPAWESLQDAPTWPIKRQGLFGILVVDAIPIVFTFIS